MIAFPIVFLVAGLAADEVAAGWQALRAGDLPSARAAFGSALAANPTRVDALDGLGYLALREGDVAEAQRRFGRALELSPADRDALMGLALVDQRQGRPADARRRLNAILARHPADAEAAAMRTRLEEAAGLDRESHPDPRGRPATIQLPMRVAGRLFELRQPDGGYRPVFLKAIDLGAALPGKFPSEFPTDPALYRHWFDLMKECGFDAVRVYTILPPVFYDTLLAFNRGRTDPLYLIHGVWVELPDNHDFSNPEFVEGYRAEIRRVVDVAHGALDLPVRPGHAGGRYRSDVSPYWIATILGREWEPFSVVAYDRSRAGTSDHVGRFVVVRGGTASERWQGEQADYAIAYETERWNAQRPTAFTNWPTLDPLHHETESSSIEEAEWARRLGIEERKPTAEDYNDDAATMDMEKFEATPENAGGLFASYHVYPYYPDFMAREYLDTRDAEGPNPFLGYLRALVAHHRKHPLFVAEFGVPTSRDPAHVHPRGWAHGGVGERRQGEIDAHMLRAIHESGAAGGALFEWIDEWFKHTWVTRPYHRPAERNPLWHDRQDPEQHFGLIAQRAGSPGPVVVIDGSEREWDARDVLLRNEGPGEIRSLSVRADESDLYLLLKVEPATKMAFAVAIDTVDPALGDVRFPAELELRARGAAFEAALLFDGARAEIMVDDSYDKFTNRFGDHNEQRPRAEDDGDYRYPRLIPNRMRISRSGKIYPRVEHDASKLRRGTTDRKDPAFDDLAEWQFDPVRGIAEFRVPWGLLNVTDPSSRAVLFESPDHPGGYRTTEGFRMAVAAFAPQGGDEIEARDGDEFEVLPRPGKDGLVGDLPLFTWPTWEEPKWHSLPKLSFGIFKEALRTVPDTPAMR